MRGESVEEGVGRRIVALSRAAEHPGGRGEQHERGQVRLAGQLVQQPACIDLGTQHVPEPLGRQGLEQPIGHQARRVHDRTQRRGVVDVGEQSGERRSVGDIAGDDVDSGTRLGEFGGQLDRARCLGASA